MPAAALPVPSGEADAPWGAPSGVCEEIPSGWRLVTQPLPDEPPKPPVGEAVLEKLLDPDTIEPGEEVAMSASSTQCTSFVVIPTASASCGLRPGRNPCVPASSLAARRTAGFRVTGHDDRRASRRPSPGDRHARCRGLPAHRALLDALQIAEPGEQSVDKRYSQLSKSGVLDCRKAVARPCASRRLPAAAGGSPAP